MPSAAKRTQVCTTDLLTILIFCLVVNTNIIQAESCSGAVFLR